MIKNVLLDYRNFLTTLSHVDEGIKEIEKVIRNFYDDDGKTTFLMTSDHGMTDWGNLVLMNFMSLANIEV